MSLLNQVFQGNPNVLGAVAAGGSPQAPNVAVDSVNGALFLSVGNGWVPLTGVAQKAVASAQVANNANVLTFTAPATGLYEVSLYEVATNAATAGTLPSITVVYTDADANVAETDTLAGGATSAAGTFIQGSFITNVKAAGTIVVATTSYAAGSGTALAYTVKARVRFLG